MNNKDDLNRCFAQLTPTAEQKERMLANILEQKQGSAVQMKKRARKLPVAVVALVCMLTVTATLAVTVGLREKVLEYFGAGSEEQVALVEQMAADFEASITENGVTVTVKQTITDSTGLYVFYEVAGLDDTILPEGAKWVPQFDMLIPSIVAEDVTGHTGFGESDVLEYGEGSLLAVVSSVSSSSLLADGDVKLYISNFGYQDTNGRFTSLVEGEWMMNWYLLSDPVGKLVEPNVSLGSDGENVVTQIAVSPISVSIKIRGEGIPAPIYVNFADGSKSEDLTKSDTSSSGGFLVDEENMVYEHQFYHRFSSLIDPDNVESVTVADITIPLG